MHRRKIQLVAGTTYSLSLPKEWVRKNHLKEKQELLLYERDDRSLIITKETNQQVAPTQISLNVDQYHGIVDLILFKLYYLGFETIELFSQKNLPQEVKSQIRSARHYMSGAEITYADTHKMIVKILLDKSKINFIQILYRLSLVLEQSLENLQAEMDLNEIDLNEKEIDRLYHLSNKILFLSLTNSTLLQTSGIKHVYVIPNYILITKKLENIADELSSMAVYLLGKKEVKHKDLLPVIQKEIHRSIRHILADYPSLFSLMPKQDIESAYAHIDTIKDITVRDHLHDCVRFLVDIEEQIVSISFHQQLQREKIMQY